MCRGTTNSKDVYLIKVSEETKKRLSRTNPKWIDGHGGIIVDLCIGKEVEYLVNHRVITLGCCCGHGIEKAECLIDSSSKELCEILGYHAHEYSKEHTENNILEIYLKNI